MQHVKTDKGGLVIYDSDDWKAGLAPQGSLTSFAKYVGVNGFTSASIDPFSTYGVLSPRIAPSDNATNSAQLSKPLVAIELTDNSTALAVDNGGKIQQITTSSATPAITNSGIYPHTIAFVAGSTYVGQDGILYRHNSGGTAPTNSVVSFFYSAYNSNNWDVGALVNLTTFDDDFMSSVPATPLDITSGDGDDSTQRAAPHPMEIGADGILYIGSGRYVHAYDGNTGSNGTFSSKVLTLPQGTQIIGMKKFKDIFLIACNFYSSSTTTGTGQALLYTWDYTSLDIIDVTDLEDFYVSSLFIWRGSPTVVTSGAVERNGANKVKVVSGNSVTKVGDYTGSQPTNRGVVVLNDVIYINSAGSVITVGDRYTKNVYPINTISIMSNNGFSGVLAYNQVRTCLMGSSGAADGTAPCFNNLDNGKGAGDCRTTLYSPNMPFGKVGKIQSITVEYYVALAAGGTNGNFSLTISVDSNNATYLVVANQSEVTQPLTKRYTRTTSGTLLNASVASFSAFQLAFSWNSSTGGSSPLVSRVIVEYDLLEAKN